MSNVMSRRSAARQLSRVAVLAVVAMVATTMLVPGASARSRPEFIVLPGAQSAEGITAGRGSEFYAGELFTGDIFRGDVHRGTAALFIDAPDGRAALGMAYDRAHQLLFVAGGFTGQGYVYDTRTGETVATYQFGDPASTFVNDVTLARDGAWFTNSVAGVLYFVPLSRHGEVGDAETLVLTGPAGEITGDFNLNGIAAARGGRTLVVAHSNNGAVYTVDPATGSSAVIEGVNVPNVDGLVIAGNRLWAVQNFSNQVSRFRLAPDLGSGTLQEVITSDLFQIPATAARIGSTLAVVNAKFDTGFPPTADQYEVVLVDD
jgi:sugar lactone lactonase YvrE